MDALEALRDAQNNFMSVWLNHHAGRIGLIRDLGLMRLDANGLWVDEPLEDAIRRGELGEIPLTPPLPESWAKALEDVQSEVTEQSTESVADAKPEPRRLSELQCNTPKAGPIVRPAPVQKSEDTSQTGWRPTREVLKTVDGSQ